MPNAEPSVVEAERRAWSYWFVDGLPHLLAGLACLLISVTFIVMVHNRHTYHPVLVFVLLALVTFVFILVFFRLQQTLQWLKWLITFPRTGYAEPPYFTENPAPASDLAMLNLSSATEKETTREMLLSEDTRWRVCFTLGIALAAALVGAFISNRPLCAAAGFFSGAVIWLVARKDPRKSWVAVYSVLFAQIFVLDFGAPLIERVSYFLSGTGLALATAGTITLVRYLRRNPARQA